MPETRGLEVAAFLPDVALPEIASGKLVSLRPAIAKTTVLAAIHSAGCGGCRRYLEDLSRAEDEFRVWDARLLVTAPVAPPDGAAVPFGRLLLDEKQVFSSPGDTNLIVADRYGHIFYICHSGARHQFPPPRELVEWLKFLGTLCPE